MNYIKTIININSDISKPEEIKQETNSDQECCCICLDNKKAFSFKTNCSHDICIECLLQMKKSICPLCRNPFPKEIDNLLTKNTEKIRVVERVVERVVVKDAAPVEGINYSYFNWSGTPMSL